MRLWLLIVSSFLWVSVSAQQYEPIRIRQFRGLETKAPEYLRGYNAQGLSIGASACHNFDLSRSGLGALTKRYGYDKVGEISGLDSIVGMYGAYYSDGTQQLIFVTDPTTTGYGRIEVTSKGGNALAREAIVYDTVTVTKFPVGGGTAPNDYDHDSVNYRIIYGSDTMVYLAAYGQSAATIVPILIDSCNTITGVSCSTCVATNKYLIKYDTTGAVQSAAVGARVHVSGGSWESWASGAAYHTSKKAYRYTGLTSVWSRFSVQNRPQFAMLNDNVWIVNGDQKGVVINGEHQLARSFPIPAPGEPLIVPYRDTNTAYRISGQVRYVMEYVCYKGATPYASDLGYTTQPVNVQDGHVLITGFQPPTSDSLMDDVDSIRVYLYRSVENPGRLDPTDSAYCIDTLSLGTAMFDTVAYVDSLPQSGAKQRPLYDKDWQGRDSLYLTALTRRPGAPGFAASVGTLSYTLATDTTRDAGIFHGIPDQPDTLGVVYVCSFIDTMISIESDTGRALAIYVDSAKGNDQGAIPLGFKVNLPKIPESDSGIVLNLYRAHILQVTYDSSYWKPTERLIIDPTKKLRIIDGKQHEYIEYLAVDTIRTSPFYLVAQVPVSDTTYTDTLRYDSLSTKRVFRNTTPPPLLNGLFSYQGRLFGWKGSNLYWSLLDSAQAWGAFDFVAVNPDDGSQITTAYPTREALAVKKDNASFNVYQDANGNWYESEISSNRGCIAPESHVAVGDNHFYLGKNYAWAEAEGGYRTRQVSVEPISAGIDNFDNLSISQKRECIAMPWGDHVIFKIGDTSYVWDEKAQAWATWSLDFDGWTYYGTEASTEFIPGDTLYFFRGSSIYRYGTSENDDSATIPIRYTTGPVFSDELDYYKAIDAVGLSVNSDDATNNLTVASYNHNDSVVSSMTFSTLSAKRYSLKAAQEESGLSGYGENRGVFFYLLIGANVTTTLGNTVIDGVDLWATKKERITVE